MYQRKAAMLLLHENMKALDVIRKEKSYAMVKKNLLEGAVIHACSPSYLGGLDGRII
jgi:hypothetical protein